MVFAVIFGALPAMVLGGVLTRLGRPQLAPSVGTFGGFLLGLMLAPAAALVGAVSGLVAGAFFLRVERSLRWHSTPVSAAGPATSTI